ncbi:MAG TPA: hypothetical protein PKB10_01705, partial [Tepidisphaeraceae bacterium]|nr:hypothetical protein [Tepidisphaeraceae bacterium]
YHAPRVVRIGCFIVLLFASPVGGATELRLPMAGVRGGRFVPLEVVVTPRSTALRIEGSDVLPIELPPGAAGRVIVPLLVWRAPQDNRLTLIVDGQPPELPARSIPASESIIGTQRGVGRDGITSEIDPRWPAPALAGYDMIALDTRAMRQLADPDRALLLGQGVRLVASGDAPPDTRWPWKPSDGAGVLEPARIGIDALQPNDPAYDATIGLSAGLESPQRRTIVYLTIGIALAMFLIYLLPRRAMLPLLLLTSAATTAAVLMLRDTLDDTSTRTAAIIALDRSAQLARIDEWQLLVARRDLPHHVPIDHGRSLVPFSRTHLEQLAPILHCDPAGRPQQLQLRLTAGRPVLLVQRRVELLRDAPIMPIDGLRWIDALARRVYASPRWHIAGRIDPAAEPGDTVILERPLEPSTPRPLQ